VNTCVHPRFFVGCVLFPLWTHEFTPVSLWGACCFPCEHMSSPPFLCGVRVVSLVNTWFHPRFFVGSVLFPLWTHEFTPVSLWGSCCFPCEHMSSPPFLCWVRVVSLVNTWVHPRFFVGFVLLIFVCFLCCCYVFLCFVYTSYCVVLWLFYLSLSSSVIFKVYSLCIILYAN
jgi:hypothetical protein